MAPETGFTDAVRQELARLPLGASAAARAELAGLLRLGGTVTVHGGTREPERVSLEVRTSSGAVARRAFLLLQRRYELRAELMVRPPGGVRRRSTYTVRVAAGASEIGRDLGLLDEAGRPREEIPAGLGREARVAYLRGAFLASGSVSAPGRPAHLEIAVRSPELADQLARLAGQVVDGTVTAVAGQRPRVVCKSGTGIGELLTVAGATNAFLVWDDRRLRRQLRADANRLANADAANLRRTIDAASDQVRAVEQAVALHGWQALDEDLRAVALARLANPAATLTEVGELVDPPLAKSVVHRRLKRLEDLARGAGRP